MAATEVAAELATELGDKGRSLRTASSEKSPNTETNFEFVMRDEEHPNFPLKFKFRHVRFKFESVVERWN